jgi:hypothetical protein
MRFGAHAGRMISYTWLLLDVGWCMRFNVSLRRSRALVIIGVLFVAACGSAATTGKRAATPIVYPSPTAIPTMTALVNTVYTSPAGNFVVQYPKGWSIRTLNDDYIQYAVGFSDAEGVTTFAVMPTRIFILSEDYSDVLQAIVQGFGATNIKIGVTQTDAMVVGHQHWNRVNASFVSRGVLFQMSMLASASQNISVIMLEYAPKTAFSAAQQQYFLPMGQSFQVL